MAEGTKVRIGLVQMSMADEPQANLQKAIEGIRKAAKMGANIICLPELFTSPYFPHEEKADASRYAETVPGPSSEALSGVAAECGVVMVGGSVFEKDGKKFYNTSFVIDENGRFLGKYRKMHIPHDPNFYEQDYFEPGDLGFRVFQTRFGKIGTLICYDQWYPEAARILALNGAEIIFYPTAIGLVDGVAQAEGDWQNAWTAVMTGHAIANGVAVCAVNRCGREGKMRFWGGSFACSQFGTRLCLASDKEEVLIADIDLGLGRAVKEGWRFFYNRRPEEYRALAKK